MLWDQVVAALFSNLMGIDGRVSLLVQAKNIKRFQAAVVSMPLHIHLTAQVKTRGEAEACSS